MSSPSQETPSNSSGTMFGASPYPKRPPPTLETSPVSGTKYRYKVDESFRERVEKLDERVCHPPKISLPSPIDVLVDHGPNDRAIKSFFDFFPAGYRFRPTDAELVDFYLRKKMRNEPLPPNMIIDINLSHHNPEDIAEIFKGTGVQEFYFFTPRDKKYPNGNRPKRSAGRGYWKATGADEGITLNDREVGLKKTLVFYEGKPPLGRKTNWIMREYRVNDPPSSRRSKRRAANDMRLDDWVLCRMYKKTVKSPKYVHEREENSTLIQHEDKEELNKDMNYEHSEVVDPAVTCEDGNGVINSTASDNTFDEFMRQILQSPLFEISQPNNTQEASIYEECQPLNSSSWTSMEMEMAQPFCSESFREEDSIWNFTDFLN